MFVFGVAQKFKLQRKAEYHLHVKLNNLTECVAVYLKVMNRCNIARQTSASSFDAKIKAQKIETHLCERLYVSLCCVYGSEEVESTFKAFSARKQQKKRIRARINHMRDACSTLVFGTLTFTDEVIEKCSEKTLKRYTKAYLVRFFNHYVANFDFSPENDRIHVHFVAGVDTKRPNYKLYNEAWQYGATKYRKVGDAVKDSRKVGTYISKLTNHAGKVSAGDVIFSRSASDGYETLKEGDELPF